MAVALSVPESARVTGANRQVRQPQACLVGTVFAADVACAEREHKSGGYAYDRFAVAMHNA
jgi:hypothetical protein